MNVSKFLNDEDMLELTGYKLAQKQSECLRQNGVSHFIRGDGKVRVTWEQVNHPYTRQSANDDDGFNMEFMSDGKKA